MTDIISLLLRHPDWLIAIVLFLMGWYFGSRAERKHLASLAQAERQLSAIIVSSERFIKPNAKHGVLVTGSVVIAQDRFKLVWASVLGLFGKNLTVYESLLDRARREALVRAKQMAYQQNCTHIYGIRFEMSQIDGGGVEVLAYGTAVHQES